MTDFGPDSGDMIIGDKAGHPQHSKSLTFDVVWRIIFLQIIPKESALCNPNFTTLLKRKEVFFSAYKLL